MLSKKSKYAIKALINLAHKHGQGPVLISTIAEEQNIPKKFLEAILLELRNAGVLHSRKGAGGGYYLAKAPADIFLSQIIRITDGPIAMVPCVSLNFYETCDDCINEEVCGIRNVFIDVRDASLNILTKTSLEDLIKREERA